MLAVRGAAVVACTDNGNNNSQSNESSEENGGETEITTLELEANETVIFYASLVNENYEYYDPSLEEDSTVTNVLVYVGIEKA